MNSFSGIRFTNTRLFTQAADHKVSAIQSACCSCLLSVRTGMPSILTPKEGWNHKVSLRWFAVQYQELFNKIITSKNDNGTFSKEDAEKQKITLPHIELQEQISRKLKKIDKVITRLEKLKQDAVVLTQSKLIG
jgi:hypothetical protein